MVLRRFAGEPREIIEQIFDQLLPAWILCCGGRGKEGEEIAGFLGGVVPARRGRGHEVFLQFVLPKPQRPLIGLDFGQETTDFGGPLGLHATVLIELHGLIRHPLPPRPPSAPARHLAPTLAPPKPFRRQSLCSPPSPAPS